MTGPRTAARALVVDDGHLLTVQYGDGDDNWYLTPGGGQRQGESLSETVRREVYEETGYEVEVESLAFVRDLVPSNHFEDGDDADHRLDHFFWCDLRADSPASPADPPELDSKQVGVEWIPLETGRRRVDSSRNTPRYPVFPSESRRSASWPERTRTSRRGISGRRSLRIRHRLPPSRSISLSLSGSFLNPLVPNVLA